MALLESAKWCIKNGNPFTSQVIFPGLLENPNKESDTQLLGSQSINAEGAHSYTLNLRSLNVDSKVTIKENDSKIINIYFFNFYMQK